MVTAYLKRGYRQARYELEKKPDSEVSSVPGAVALEEGYGDEIAAPLDEAMELQYPEDVLGACSEKCVWSRALNLKRKHSEGRCQRVQ